METNEVIIDNEEYTDFIQDNSETVSFNQVSTIEEIDLSNAGFIGFGLASTMCIISIGIASILRMFKSAR